MSQFLFCVHLVGFASCAFMSALLITRERRTPGNRALWFLMLSGASWSLLELFLHLPDSFGHELAALRIAGIFHLSGPFLFVDFACALAGRRRGADWKILGASTFAAIALYLTTDLAVEAAARGAVGCAIAIGKYGRAFDCFEALGQAYAVWVMYRGFKEAREPTLRKAFRALVIGLVVADAVAVAAELIANPFLEGGLSVRSVGVPVFTPFVGLALLRHGFFSADISKAASELFADAKDGIVILDRYDRIRQMNPAAVEMLNTAQEAAVGETVTSLIPVWKELVTCGKTEMERVCDDDTTRRLALSSSAQMRRGRRFGRFLLVRDLTDRFLAKEALARSREELEVEVVQRAAELEVAQRMETMGALIGSIAHDFNNLLAAILGFATAARDDLPERHAIRRDLDEILSAARKARDTVTHLLSFGGQGAARRKPLEIGELLDTSLSFVATSLPVSIALERKACREKIHVMGDATQLHQVIVNLTTNAAQAIGSRKGTITVGASVVRLLADAGSSRRPVEPGETVVITVGDDGPGIKGELLERVFDPFFSTKNQREGSGLGLAMAQRIARDHGGAITVDSEEGKGTVFSIHLPFIEPPSATAALERALETGSEHILVVDGDTASSRKTRKTLISLGYRVTSHTDPREALEAYRKTPGAFDAAIIDMELRGANGLDVAAEMLEERESAAILLIASRLQPELSRAARRLRVTTVVEKPVSPNVLAATVRRMLDSSGRASQPGPL